MFSRPLVVLMVCLVLVLVDPLVSGQRLYMRHKRSVERENEPAKESTVVIQGPNSTSPTTSHRDLPKDFENDIAPHEKDCRDFFEFDYNPINDSVFFNGRLPSPFHHQNPMMPMNPHHNPMQSFEQMFHRMMQQASQMFNNHHRFPGMNPIGAGSGSGFGFPNANYPDNYNGTEEEIVNIGGAQFRKKQHIINKTAGGSKISIMSTVYEPVEASEGNNNSTASTNAEAGTVRDDLTDGKIISYK